MNQRREGTITGLEARKAGDRPFYEDGTGAKNWGCAATKLHPEGPVSSLGAGPRLMENY
jgi:hypothetical protein